MEKSKTTVGIDDMVLYIPKLYLPIETLAQTREIEYAKLNKGLGLTKMAIPDTYEDAATMAANAVAQLIEQNNLDPRQIGRIYMGTESALDGAKPTATYVLEMLRRKYRDQYGIDCLLHCDVVDLTFACVGGVDALQNTLDWVGGDTDRIGIVVTSDVAKYELASTGEYTQGAGAVAMLVKHNPRFLAIGPHWGVATVGVHDFFKPKKEVDKAQLVQEVLDLAGITDLSAEEVLARLPQSLEVNGILDENDQKLTMRKETPIFDGPYSNQCYQHRIRDAFMHYRQQAESEGLIHADTILADQWARLIFHLPYAYHAKRVFSEIFMLEWQRAGRWDDFAREHELKAPERGDHADQASFDKAYGAFLRAITKTPSYRAYIQEAIERSQRASSQVGNMYACSIFLALISSVYGDWQEGNDLTNKTMGFFGYGSGSKSKVFTGTLQKEWKMIVERFQLQQKLDNRVAISYATYEQIHRGLQTEPVTKPQGTFFIKQVGTEGVKAGARYYEWAEEVAANQPAS